MSHHISGPRAMAEPIADITDLYAFPSPEQSGRLVLVLNTLPFAPPSAVFSDGLIYRFRLRPLTANARQDPVPFVADGEETVIDCVFSTPVNGHQANGPEQEGTCWLPTGETVSARVNDERGGQVRDVRMFAGPRWDPFIMDAAAALKTIATGKLVFTDPSVICLDGKNILSLVVEVDCARLLGGSELFGVVAETLTRGSLNVRLERAGRPEVPNLMLAPKQFDQVNRDPEIRDLYNMEDAFHLSDVYQGAYRSRLNANLAFWDGLDGKTDWPAGEDGAHPLTELMLADYLVVDVAKPYAEQGSFMEIEGVREQLPAALSQEREHAARRHQVPGDIAGVPQITIGLRDALHETIIPSIRTPCRQKRRNRDHGLFSAVLAPPHAAAAPAGALLGHPWPLQS